ncbi:phage portal protein, SPP1 family [Alkalithermobacter thermoalcaliphilus JW-YL-7 = DSM 7308]|uniref:Phage portal protein, SPP1 family n=1 Tax=Alkalithermobacter thermoalcaliphilus JW-YL-7 = DSM 7308 TaxID=1121328 RepID=A0A150FQJ3_CLOPD|nr:phage portal protein, SPP1 family [[Clostridium] paradoxum JW-YL-7 = DSM 7308]SHK50280.1 phage portal protein, SPP1 family [[Clostridium] paradoxum JW-YL-7 = DSM 7308]
MDNLDGKFIKQEIDKHREKRELYKYYDDIYIGKHPILNKTINGIDNANNKVVANFDKYVIDATVGYFLGKPVIIQHNKSDNIQYILEDIFTENDKDDLFVETGIEVLKKGKAYWFIYQDEFGNTKIKKVKPDEVIVIKNATTDEIERVYRYYYLEDIENNKLLLYVEAYKGNKVYYYVENERTGELILDYSRQNPTTHIFGRIPFVEIVNNEQETSEIDVIYTIRDTFSKILSYTADEFEAFRNAYIVINSGENVNEEDVLKLKDQGIISLDEGGNFRFETKNVNTDGVEKHLDRLEKLLHKLSGVPDMSDENFGGNLSGVSLKLKFAGLEHKCIIKERKFTKAIRDLLKILKPVIELKTGEKFNLRDIDIQFIRNIPTNDTEYIDEIVKLQGTGLIDKETLLSRLPFISDPLAILEKVEAEQEKYIDFHKVAEEIDNNVM